MNAQKEREKKKNVYKKLIIVDKEIMIIGER